VATATSGADPVDHADRPDPGHPQGARPRRLTVDDIDLFELNEAFASVVLKFQKDLNIPDEKLNVNGGAIAMGQPAGCHRRHDFSAPWSTSLEAPQRPACSGDALYWRRHGCRDDHREGLSSMADNTFSGTRMPTASSR